MTRDADSRLSERRPPGIRIAELLEVGSLSLRTRKLRATLSALGVAIGIAALVGVLGVSESSKAQLLDQLNALGTNLLTVTPGNDFLGGAATLPKSAQPSIRRIDGVEKTASTQATTAKAYRNPLIDPSHSNALDVRGADADLLDTVAGSVAIGRWLDVTSTSKPFTVLGSVAAQRLGVDRPGAVVTLGDQQVAVIGILDPVTLAPEIDRSALVGGEFAQAALGGDGSAGTIYVRTQNDRVTNVRSLLAATANPNSPQEVTVSRPSDALAAQVAAKGAFTSLLLGVGAIALLVGGIGIANVMVISVIERRSEIGLRRALGATQRQIAGQFVTESVLLSTLGGAGGVGFGAALVAGFAAWHSWRTVIPAMTVIGGLGAAVFIGVFAGLYPAVRAARLSPTDALRSP